MAVKHVHLDDRYIPKTTTKDIIVEVRTGDGQDASASYSIFSGIEFIEANAPANIGKKAAVEEKVTTVSVTVMDTLKETDWTSMTVIVKEGNSITRFGPYRTQAENHLDTVIYTLKLVHQ